MDYPYPKAILFVDDEGMILELYHHAFSRLGFDVLMANDSESALKIVTDKEPDFALLDYSIGDDSGIDLGVQIRRISPNTALYLITGNANGINTGECINSGFIGVFEKPISISKLIAVFLLSNENR